MEGFSRKTGRVGGLASVARTRERLLPLVFAKHQMGTSILNVCMLLHTSK